MDIDVKPTNSLWVDSCHTGYEVNRPDPSIALVTFSHALPSFSTSLSISKYVLFCVELWSPYAIVIRNNGCVRGGFYLLVYFARDPR